MTDQTIKIWIEKKETYSINKMLKTIIIVYHVHHFKILDQQICPGTDSLLTPPQPTDPSKVSDDLKVNVLEKRKTRSN